MIQYDNFTAVCHSHTFTEDSYMELREEFGRKLGSKKCWEEIQKSVRWYQEKGVVLTPEGVRRWLSKSQ